MYKKHFFKTFRINKKLVFLFIKNKLKKRNKGLQNKMLKNIKYKKNITFID